MAITVFVEFRLIPHFFLSLFLFSSQNVRQESEAVAKGILVIFSPNIGGTLGLFRHYLDF